MTTDHAGINTSKICSQLCPCQQLLDQLEQILQRVPSDRAHLLSDGELTLCERKSVVF